MAKLTGEEEQLTESSILLEMARKVLEIDLARMDQTPLKLKDPYIRLLEVTLYRLSRQLYVTRFTMKQLDLKIQLIKSDKTFSEYMIFFRGYVLTVKYLNAHLKNQVSRKIEDLFIQGKKEVH
jgi:hypothetical protein